MSHLTQELRLLKADLLNMMRLTRSQLMKGRQVFIDGDSELALEVLSNEKRVNLMELNIDRKCQSILALYQPVAVDLRFVISAQKINFHLERIGDYAEGISLSINENDGKAYDKTLIDELGIINMFNLCLEMFDESILSLKNEDSELAGRPFETDKLIDVIYLNSKNIAVDIIKANPERAGECFTHYANIRKLERIGDLIKNVCEEIIFYIDAKVLKHNL